MMFICYYSFCDSSLLSVQLVLVLFSFLFLSVLSCLFLYSNLCSVRFQEIVSECSLSLLAASKAIVRQSGSDIDGQLFLIKHLLILREQITPFDIEFAIVVKQVSNANCLL